jgi:hypothetical protein
VRAYLGPDAAYRLLQLLRRAGTSTRALDSSKGRRPQPPSFSDAPRGSLARSDGARRAALRPFTKTPVPVPPGCPGLPDRDVPESAWPRDGFPPWVEPRLTCTGLRTEQRTRPLGASGLASPRVGCSRIFGRGLTSFPSSASEEHRLSSVRPHAEEEASSHVTDRPRSALRRRPAKGSAFLQTRCFPPPRRRAVRRIAPPAFPRRPPAHAAHTFSPAWGKCFFEHCKRSP